MTKRIMKPNILHVIDTTGPGGAETVFLDLAEECLRQGYGSTALIRGPGWVEEQLKKRAVPYLIEDCKGSLNFRFLASLIATVRRLNVTHIQSHLLGSNVYTSLVGLLLRIPVITTFHGHVDISEKERFRNAKLTIIRAGAAKVVCVTEELRATITNSTTGPWRLNPVVVPNGADITKLETLPLHLRRRDSGPVLFGCLGNIRPAKNYQLAVDFIKQLKSQGIDCRLLIAGDDTKPLAKDLKRYIREQGLDDQVTFLGFIDDVPDFFQKTDVFLMTSSSEGHPLALTQAMAAGCPVLSTRNGVEKIVPRESLFLSDEHSAVSLSQAYEALDASEGLPELLATGREFIREHYSQVAMFSNYTRFYAV